MRETPTELTELQQLLDSSHARSGPHLQSIIEAGRRTPSAAQVVAELTGMKVLVVTTVSPSGRPRSSAVDGHFLHGHWTFSTSGDAVKAADLASRPAVSAAYVDGERFALFSHGDAELVAVGHADYAELEAYLTEYYGSSPTTWGPSIVYYAVRPRYMVSYAPDAEALPAG
jgi:general stress protein 26